MLGARHHDHGLTMAQNYEPMFPSLSCVINHEPVEIANYADLVQR